MRRISRRHFLGTSSVALTALPLIRATAFAQTADAVFRHGVASGDPLADRIILWTRVTPAAPADSARVRWQVARDPKFTQIVSLLGQQVMFAPQTASGAVAGNPDPWVGYRASRSRVFDPATPAP